MEELADGRCNVVYYCANTSENVSETYESSQPPERSSTRSGSLEALYENVRMLLDEDQGGFHEVFLSSSAKECWDRIESHSGSIPTVVLVGSPLPTPGEKLDAREKPPLSVLRALNADIQGARYTTPVMPFVVCDGASKDDKALDADCRTEFLHAGAVEILSSPLRHEDLARLVGHVKEEIRPPARLVGVNMARNLADSIRNMSVPGEPCHRPDRIVSIERQSFVKSAIAQWHFPAHEMNMDELTCAVIFMVEDLLQSPALQEYSISRTQIVSFLLATRRQYKHEREVHYHNWRHAVDVTQSIYSFLKYIGVCPCAKPGTATEKDKTTIESLLTPLDGLILLVSGIGHDVGHPGVNNAFLVACEHPLAQMYNDKSVLENYHCAAYTQLLRRHWPALGKVSGFRASMISNILATDMQRHFEYMATLGALQKRVADGDNDTTKWSDKDKEQTRELLMAILIKGADISNVARPFDISAAWAKILMNEFARQGELEAELQIPTCLFGGPPNVEDSLGAAQSQKGFMNLFGFPLFQGIAEIVPSVACAINTLEHNQATWESKIQAEKDRRNSEGKSAPLTFSSVGQDEVDQAQIMHHRSEPGIVPLESAQAPSSPVKRHMVNPRDHSTTHPAAEDRRRLAEGFSPHDDSHRASAPILGGWNSSSRRSSKDVALDQFQQLSMTAQQGSRRGSADAGVHINQSFPASRRGSKDESLTTILVKAQGSPRQRSPQKESKRQSHKQRNSVPVSPRSHATSSATANTTSEAQHSISTLASSLATTEDGISDDTFAQHTPSDSRRSSPTDKELPSPRVISRMESGDSQDTGRLTPRKHGSSDHAIRESRSRSRLRGLKFWKKKKSDAGIEAHSSDTATSP